MAAKRRPEPAETRAAGPGRAALALAVAILCGGLAVGCETVDPAQLLRNSLEGLARGACRAAANCSNTCPDGSEARGPLYRCPSAGGSRRP